MIWGEKMGVKKERQKKRKVKRIDKKGGLTVSLKTANKIKLISVILVILILVSIAAAQISGVTVSMASDGLRTFIAKIGSGEGYQIGRAHV